MGKIVSGLFARIRELDPFVGGMDPFRKVTAILLETKIPANYFGFEYLRRAILITYEDPDGVLIDGIYVRLIQHYGNGLSVDAIEQAMRNAINAAWKNKKADDWILYFSQDADGKIKRPKSTELISRIAKFLEIWQGVHAKEGSEIE